VEVGALGGMPWRGGRGTMGVAAWEGSTVPRLLRSLCVCGCLSRCCLGKKRKRKEKQEKKEKEKEEKMRIFFKTRNFGGEK
jgi:hypothetical protein